MGCYQMVETNKPEPAGISDEELMRLTMALDDDDFNFEEDFQEVDLNPSKVSPLLNQNKLLILKWFLLFCLKLFEH
jgi:hypothetical protein